MSKKLKQKQNSVESINSKINNLLLVENNLDKFEIQEGEGEGVAEQTQKRIVELTKELRQMLKAKESCHYARYIHKHHFNVIDAVNEAFDNFKRSDDVNENKLYFAKAIEAKTKLSAKVFQKSTAYDVLCEFEKFVNAKTDNEVAIVDDTRKQLREGVALALMTTQTQTFNHLLDAEKVEAEKQADAEAIEAQAENAIAEA